MGNFEFVLQHVSRLPGNLDAVVPGDERIDQVYANVGPMRVRESELMFANWSGRRLCGRMEPDDAFAATHFHQ